MGHFVSFDQVSKIYRMGEVTIKAADKISFCLLYTSVAADE